MSGRLGGAVLTSWTVHLFLGSPADALHRAPEVRRRASVRQSRGFPGGLRPGAFRHRRHGLLLRRGAAREPGPVQLRRRPRVLQGGAARREFVADRVEEIAKKGELGTELETCELRLAEYREGLALFGAYAKVAKTGRDELKAWDLAARNLINRAEASRILLKRRIDGAGPGIASEAGRVLEGLRALRRETEAAVATEAKPSRTSEMVRWMYDSMDAALEKATGR